MLAQQASGYDVGGRSFHIQEKSMHEDLEFSRAGTDESAKPTALVGLADSPVIDPANLPKKLSNRPSGTSSDVGTDLCDWRTPLLAYLRDPSAKVDKSVRWSAFKYMLHNDELY
jgi:hypothetical protein